MTRRPSYVSGVIIDARNIQTTDDGWTLTLQATVHRDYPGSGGRHSPDDDSEETYTVPVSGLWGDDGEPQTWDHGVWSGRDSALDDIHIGDEAAEAMERRTEAAR